jgi:hypothetical protein
MLDENDRILQNFILIHTLEKLGFGLNEEICGLLEGLIAEYRRQQNTKAKLARKETNANI